MTNKPPSHFKKISRSCAHCRHFHFRNTMWMATPGHLCEKYEHVVIAWDAYSHVCNSFSKGEPKVTNYEMVIGGGSLSDDK